MDDDNDFIVSPQTFSSSLSSWNIFKKEEEENMKRW